MKKIILLFTLLAFVAALSASESDPSETVGFFKCDTYGYSTIALPFGYSDYEVNNVMGSQGGFTNGDKLTDMNSGTVMTYYGPTNGWWPTSNLVPGNGYLLNTAADSCIYLAGDVNPSTINKTINPGYTVFALDESREVLISDATLGIPNLISGDKITDINNGTVTTYYGATNGWWPDDNYIIPTHVYLLNTAYGSSFTWTYTPDPPGSKKVGNKPVFHKEQSRSFNR